MSRRQARRAPVEHKVATADVAEKFNKKFLDILQTVSPPRAELIQRMLSGSSLRRIALMDEISFEEAYFLFTGTISRLRHSSRAELLRAYDLDEDDFTQVVRLLSEAADGGDGTLMRCEFHGWTESQGLPQCSECCCELPIPSDAFHELAAKFGRPRRYCSNACRQRAYRLRRKAAATVDH